jgi:hypothetical protein
LAWDRDIPPGSSDILKTLVITCVGGYITSSAYEAARPPRDIPHETEVGSDEGENN